MRLQVGVCGGCRARAAYYHDGDILGQDNYCAWSMKNAARDASGESAHSATKHNEKEHTMKKIAQGTIAISLRARHGRGAFSGRLLIAD